MERFCLSTFFGKRFPRLSSLSSSHDFPHFQCFTCKNVLIWYKSQNSRYFSFLLPYSFALKNMLFFFLPHFLLCCFIYFFHSRRLFLCTQLVSICSYMCWASIMSKYLASMIWGSTLFLNTEQSRHLLLVRPEMRGKTFKKKEKKKSKPLKCQILSDKIYHFLLGSTSEQEHKSTIQWWLMYKYVSALETWVGKWS